MKQSRRNMLKGMGKSAAVAAAGATVVAQAAAPAAALEPVEKRSPYPVLKPQTGKPMYSRGVAYGNMLFLSGVGYHQPDTIEVHTQKVLEELKKNLEDAGSSMQKVLKVNVYLNDLKDYDRMNAVYRSFDWGDVPPVRTTVAPAAGIPGNSLIEIDMIAYI